MTDTSQPQGAPRDAGSHFQPSLRKMLVILFLFALAAFVMLRSPGAAGPNFATPNITTPAGQTTNTSVPVSQVRVQVANGTATAGLARTYTQQLMTLGWNTLPEMNGPKVNSTIIYYNPGFLWAAQSIATALKVNASVAQPLNGQQPVAGASSDDVIVILGPELAVAG